MSQRAIIILALTHGDQGGSLKHLNSYLSHLNTTNYSKVYIVTNLKDLDYSNLDIVFLPTNIIGIGPYLSICVKLLISALSNMSKNLSVIDFFNPIFLPSRARQIAIIRDVGELKIRKYDRIRMFYRLNIMLPLSVNFARKIICISNSTKYDLLEYFPKAKHKTCVIYHGADQYDGTQLTKNKRNYFVYIGRLDAYGKNLINTLSAYEKYVDSGGQFDLILIGAKWRNSDEITDLISSSSTLTKRVTIKGYVSYERKVEFLRYAKCLIFLSRYEGFGHPILEAHAHGCATLCSDISVFREVAGEFATYVDHENIDEIVSGLFKMENLRYSEVLLERLTKNVERFQWSDNFRSYGNVLGICDEEALK